jgi:hypothetical protein
LESIISELLRQLPTTGLIILAIVFGIKSVLDKLASMSRRMDCFEKSQHVCQLDIAKTYATKDELHEVEAAVVGHESRISRIEGGK